MNCTQVNQLKEAYVDGLLAPAVRAAVDAHAAGCALCRDRLAVAAQVRAGLGPALKATLRQPGLTPAQAAALHEQVRRRAAPAGLLRAWAGGLGRTATGL